MISVVVPTRNAASTLDEQLAALAAQDVDGPWEVIVADHGSTDATRVVVESWRDRLPLRVVDVPGGGGASRARNIGLRSATGEYLLLCDADDVVEPGWVRALVDALQEADLVGGYQLPFSTNTAAYAWNRRKPDTLIPGGFHARHVYAWSAGCNLAMRASVFRTVQFPEDFGTLPGEDIAFCWMVQQAGFRFAVEPRAVVRYRLRGTLSETIRQNFWWGFSWPRLRRDFPSAIGPQSWKLMAGRWMVVAGLLYRSRSRDDLGAALVIAAHNVGRICGSIRYRVIGL